MGNNNYVNVDRLITVAGYNTATMRRIVKEAEQAGLLLDFTGALTTKAIVLMDNGVTIRIPLRASDVSRALSQLDSDSE